MLSALRNAAGTWVAKLLLLLLVVSFAVWGISGSLVTGFGGNSVVTVGGTTVSPIEYRLAYDRQLAVFPAGYDPDKYWPPVSRIDQAYGDRNLVCACPSPEAFAE